MNWPQYFYYTYINININILIYIYLYLYLYLSIYRQELGLVAGFSRPTNGTLHTTKLN